MHISFFFKPHLQVVLENLGKVVLQLVAAKVHQDLLPIGRVGEIAQVGLHFAGEDFQCGGFANAVFADETEHLAGARSGQSEKDEQGRGEKDG